MPKTPKYIYIATTIGADFEDYAGTQIDPLTKDLVRGAIGYRIWRRPFTPEALGYTYRRFVWGAELISAKEG